MYTAIKRYAHCGQVLVLVLFDLEQLMDMCILSTAALDQCLVISTVCFNQGSHSICKAVFEYDRISIFLRSSFSSIVDVAIITSLGSLSHFLCVFH